MLHPKFAAIRLKLLAASLIFLTACSGNPSVEGWFAPDPNLKNTPASGNSQQPQGLPENWPAEIPLYPAAKFIEIDPQSTGDRVQTRWNSNDPSNLIESFYQQQFTDKNWQIVQPFSPDTGTGETPLIARREGLEVTVTVLPTSPTAKASEFFLAYQLGDALPSPSPSPTSTAGIMSNSGDFSDLDSISPPLRRYVQDLAKLGVLTASGSQFHPEQPISRREYARWLVAANNAIHANAPSKQIRLAAKTVQPAFRDVPARDGDFPAIQGLAEAGLLPSRLSGDDSALLFRPDAPLTREELILWKLPLDTRKALPSASIDSIKATWGFQDAGKINPKAMGAIYGDFQNGERANIRRVFGYTTLLQPKQSVTRAEAAAALWYFGVEGDGMSAEDALQARQ